MYPYLGNFALNTTIFFPFCTYNSAGASVTITGLAVTDIEIYKNASMTQRSSDSGYALVDTDGIDLDSTTGFHGFTVDTSDNSDAGFYAAGNDYTVVVSTITADSQTVTFIAGRFSLVNRIANVTYWNGAAVATPSVSGTPAVDVTAINGTAANAVNLAASSGQIYVGHIETSAFTSTTTEFESDDITTATADHWIGRVVIFTSGTLAGQATKITDYAKSGSFGHFTVDALTSAPADEGTFIIV